MMYGGIQCIVSKGINWKSGSIIAYTLGTWVGEKQNKTSVFGDKKPFRKEGVVDWWCLPVGLNDIGYSPSCHLWQQSITLTPQRGLTENTHQTIRIRKSNSKSRVYLSLPRNLQISTTHERDFEMSCRTKMTCHFFSYLLNKTFRILMF